ncbi:MAG: DUF4242 domain-containing protein [Thermomicrobiales bacterium]
MPKFLVERKIPSAGRMSLEELRATAATSNDVVHDMQRDGTPIQWVQGFVTDDAIFCVYLAPDAEAIRGHASTSGFPADQVMDVRAVIDPTTGE